MLSAIVVCMIPFERFTLMLLQEDKSSLCIFLLSCFCKLSVETQKSKSLCALLLVRESRVYFLCFYLSFVPDPLADTREIRCRFCFSLVSFLYNDDLILPSSSLSSTTSDEQFHHFHFQCLISCLRPSGAMNGYKFPCGGSCVERKVLYVCTRSKAHDLTRKWRKFHLQFPTWWRTRSAWHCTHLITKMLPICILKFKTLATLLQGQYVCLRSPDNKSVCKGLWLSIEACWTIHNLQVWLHGLCTIWRFCGSITIWTA